MSTVDLTWHNHHYSCGGFIKGILRGVRCTKSLRVLFLHRRPPSWTTLVLYSRVVFIFNEPAFGLVDEPFSPWTKAMDIVFYVSMFDRLLCTEAGISKNHWRNKLRFTWGWAEVLSMASYCPNREQVGLTWALLSVPIMCIFRDGPQECGGRSKDDCLTLSQPLGSVHWLYSSHYLSAAL